MPDLDPEQLTLFTSSIDYSVRLTAPGQVQDWPLPAASNLEEAIDAARGLGLFLLFHQGIMWNQEWDNEDAFVFTGFTTTGGEVRLEVLMQDAYIDREGKRL